MMPTDNPPVLTERERQILQLIATGTSNKEIARRLSISTNTVKVHLRNIFVKIGASSRTEAAIYSLQAGFTGATPADGVEPSAPPTVAEFIPSPTLKKRLPLLWILLLPVLLLASLVLWMLLRERQPAVFPVSPVPTPLSRWTELADMPTARSGLAVALYENQIFAFGGETVGGISTAAERFDLATDTWFVLAPIPVAVTDVNAGVIGGQIYVPGGLLASGGVTDLLQVYDPTSDSWDTLAPLPRSLGRYALAAFEGKLYVFGGWDGQHALNTVFEYQPDTDTWLTRTPMPTPREYAGAAVAGGKIYLVGGFDGRQALAVNEVYSPQLEGIASPWSQAEPLPAASYNQGVASLADNLYLFGGHGSTASLMVYLSQTDQWQSLDAPIAEVGEGCRLVQVGGFILLVGGRLNQAPSPQTRAYQAIYTVELPFVIYKK